MSKAKEKLTTGDAEHNRKRCADYRARRKAGIKHAPVQLIAADDIIVVCNPRKKFPEAKQRELVESMRAHGLLQPLVVRHLPDGKFELIAGERRLRGARELGWLVIPCSVRTMTEAEAAVLRILENLQRVDLEPMEEAEGFQTLMSGGMSAVELAGLVHKSRHYVYEGLLLLRLPSSAREALEAGTLGRTLATVIGRIEDSAKREEMAAIIVSKGLNFRQAMAYLRNNAGKQLEGVPWDRFDEALLPAAGSCDACVKRCEDVCPDVDCWQAKRAAWMNQQREKFQAQGVAVVDESVVFGERGELRWDSGVVVLEDKLDPNLIKPAKREEVRRQTWDDLIPGATASVVIRSDGTVSRILATDTAIAAATKAGYKGLFAKTPGGDFEQRERERRLQAREEKVETAILQAQIASDLGAIDRGMVTAEDFFKVPELMGEILLAKVLDGAAADYFDPKLMPETWKLAKHFDDGGELSPGEKWRLPLAMLLFGDEQGMTDAGRHLARGLGIELTPLPPARIEAIRAEIEGRFEDTPKMEEAA